MVQYARIRYAPRLSLRSANFLQANVAVAAWWHILLSPPRFVARITFFANLSRGFFSSQSSGDASLLPELRAVLAKEDVRDVRELDPSLKR